MIRAFATVRLAVGLAAGVFAVPALADDTIEAVVARLDAQMKGRAWIDGAAVFLNGAVTLEEDGVVIVFSKVCVKQAPATDQDAVQCGYSAALEESQRVQIDPRSADFAQVSFKPVRVMETASGGTTSAEGAGQINLPCAQLCAAEDDGSLTANAITQLYCRDQASCAAMAEDLKLLAGLMTAPADALRQRLDQNYDE